MLKDTNDIQQAEEVPVSSLSDAESWAAPRQRQGMSHGYSRFVHLMKVLLPAAAVVMLILIMAWPHFQIKDKRFSIGFSTIKMTGGQDKSMINPRFLGTDKKTKPFSITADIAKNIMVDASVVELEMPKADITLPDGSWLVLTANTGVFDKNRKKLELRKKVNLFHDSGYEFRTSSADVDLIKGVAEGNQPISGQGSFGTLSAEGFRLVDKGRIIHFIGKSKVIMYPNIGQSLKENSAANKKPAASR